MVRSEIGKNTNISTQSSSGGTGGSGGVGGEQGGSGGAGEGPRITYGSIHAQHFTVNS